MGFWPSSTSLKIRLIALSGLEIVSPVFCRNRRASSPSVWAGVGSESGCADSSPTCDVVKDGVEGEGAMDGVVDEAGVVDPVLGSD